MKRFNLISTIVSFLFLSALSLMVYSQGLCTDIGAPSPGTDCDDESLIINFNIVETVVVIIENGNQTVTLDVEDNVENIRYVDFNRFRIRTGSITDYELHVSGDAQLRDGAFTEPLPVEMFQVRLFAPGITGHSPVEINPNVTEFIDMVKLPDSIFVWTGLNNTEGDLNTFGPMDARVDLSQLPSDALRSGVDLEYTVRFFILER